MRTRPHPDRRRPTQQPKRGASAKRRPRWQRRPDDRPTEIIEAAFRVFGEHGLAATRLEDVARDAGVSKGTIYLYFDSKEALFRAVVRAKIVTAIERAERALDEEPGPSGVFRAFAKRHWEFVTSRDFDTMHRLVNGELTRFPDLARFYGSEVIARSIKLLTTVMERSMARGELRTGNPRHAASAFSAMFITHGVWYARRQLFGCFTDEPPEQVRDRLIDFFLQAAGPTERHHP